jgi:hypothetical protein
MNKIFKIYVPLIIVVASLLLSTLAFTKEPTNRKSLAKAMALETEVVDGNRIFNYINNRGAWCTANNPIGWGMQWPGESGLSVNFASGVWVAGMVGTDIRTACAEYSFEFQPGPIIDGVAPATDDPSHTIAKVNKADLLDEGFTNPDYDLWLDYAKYGAPVMKAIDGSDSLSASGKKIPAMIGDQMLWMVMNDLDPGAHSGLYHTNPIGLEVQTLVWVFNRPDEFGDMMFMKFLIVNKGANPLEDTYVGLWFDIDLGDSNDDLVFCDTTLSLGAFWNGEATDNEFPIPPAVGSDFFQGPIVASSGDTANVSGVKFAGYKNLPMSSFVKYVRGGPADLQDPETALEAYNFMRGFNSLGEDVLNPITFEVTKFVNISDPETGEGWVDGVTDLPADRRMLMNTGPFTLDVWIDTNGDGIPQVGEPGVQEVVAGFMIAQGTSAANSATRLKQADEKAQLAYDLNFALPPVPENPNVEVHELDGEIVLTWDDAIESYTAIDRVDVNEEGNPTYYTFQGYNVYQVNTPTVGPDSRILKVATYDIEDGVKDIRDFVFSEQFGENVEGTVQRATDSGINRTFRTIVDALNGNRPLSNWNRYWFVVTAYGYNENGVPKKLESPFTTVEVVPQPPAEGLQAVAKYNEMIAAVTPDTTFDATHSSTGTLSDGQLEVIVVDPSKITGKDYEVTFEKDETTGVTTWNLDRIDEGGKTRLLSKQTNQAGDEAYNVVDGLKVKSIGPALDFKRFLVVANAAGPLDPPEIGCFAFNASGFPTVDGLPPNEDGTNDRPDAARQQTNGSTWGFDVGGGNGLYNDGSGSSFVDRVCRNDNWTRIVPYDFEMRFTAEGGMANWGFEDGVNRPVPFELWNIGIGTPDDASDDYRMVPLVLNDTGEAPEDGTYNINPSDSPISGGDNDPYMDWVYWYTPIDVSPGTAGYDAFVSSGDDSQIDAEVMARTILVNWNGGSVSDSTFPANVDAVMPEVGTVFRILTTKPNSAADKFTFTTANYTPTTGRELAKTAAQQVNIFPNPYLGQNRAEINPVTRFVTITHLPESGATIRIFTLAGSLIKTINDDIRSTQGTLGSHVAQWDLRNDNDVPIASGIYIIHIDMGDLGEKVLKAAVFMPEERLDKF